VKQPRKRGSGSAAKEYELDVRECDQINSALSNKADVSGAKCLSANEGTCYTGQYPRHEGFMLNDNDARQMLRADGKNREVIWPFLVGRELLSQGLDDRWVIDFQTRTILAAKSYAEPFKHIEQVTLPYISEKAAEEREKTKKDTGQDQGWLNSWWQHFRPRAELIGKITKLRRYIVCSRITKRPIFVFISSEIRPGDALSCFALGDDYSFGILQSNSHWQWFREKCSKMKSDFRYTPESVFDTFPWPQMGTVKQIEAVAAAACELRHVRAEALSKIKGGLRALYRTLELPGANPLKDAHAVLDAAVLTAYGFNAKKDLLAQLLALNQDVAAKIEKGEPVTAPGVPKNYPDAKKLVTEDCIKPASEKAVK
jgi:hypothetical protein